MLAAYGAYARPLRVLVDRLATAGATPPGTGAWATGAPAAQARAADTTSPVGRLVRATGLPRRTVEDVLTALGADVENAAASGAGRGGGDRSPRGTPGRGARIRPDRAAGYLARIDVDQLRASTPADPLAGQLAGHRDLVATMRALIAAAPRSRADLDHVSATAATAVRRAVWLGASYDLAGRHLLCVGDHDLTSLAAAAAVPGLRVTVVDVDDDLLAFIDREARRRALPVRTRFADLRFGLPPDVVADADLAFTDPPYSPEGVALFCARGAEGLRERDHGRVLLAYGFSDRTPTLGLRTQRALGELGFALEAMLPHFHEYDGAEAIGARADLYVCRPTALTWRQIDRAGAGGGGGRSTIYTRGRSAVESAESGLDETVTRVLADAVEAATTGPAGTGGTARLARLVVVGETVPPGAGPVGHVRLPTVLDHGLPPAVRGPNGTAVLADLTRDPGAWLSRLLLATNAEYLTVVVRADHPALGASRRPGAGAVPPGPALPAVLAPLAAKWTTTRSAATRSGMADLVGAPGPGASADRLRLLTFRAVDPAGLDPADRLVRWLLDRAHGTLGNVWREGLIRISQDELGVVVSKREARARLAAALADHAGAHPVDARPVDAGTADIPGAAPADVTDASAGGYATGSGVASTAADSAAWPDGPPADPLDVLTARLLDVPRDALERVLVAVRASWLAEGSDPWPGTPG
jgi:hypothetical protein